MEITSHQEQALQAVKDHPVALLTGTPGSGKSYLTAKIIHDLIRSGSHGGIAVAAPTGKAARRMTEAMAEHGLKINATTIHRLLEYTYVDGHGIFSRNERNPLPHGNVFIDEVSMAPVDWMARLLSARRRGSNFLFIGDPNQLSPVGHGAPLRDMIAMRIPRGHLSEIHRNAGRIVRTCKSIVDQHRWESSPGLDVESGENLFVDSQWRDPASQIESMKAWLNPGSALFDSWKKPVDLIWDCQVVVPLNAKSTVSRKQLNKILQAHLNPGGKRVEGMPFRENDKIVCGKNGWYVAGPGCPPGEMNDDYKVYCANGEQGRVIEVNAKHMLVEMTIPHRVVRVGRSKSDDGEGFVWELAYAISCHKSQGAEWPAVIVVGDESNSAKWLMDRHWLLTAISRASTVCVCVAKPGTLQECCRKSHLWKRKTQAVEKYFELLVAR